VASDRNGLEILSRSECMRLLESTPIGRVGVSIGALPVILPVNFAVVDGDIVIRTSAGTKLDAAAINLVVAFEVDGFDPVWHSGWSVLVQGVGEEVTDPDELQRLRHVRLAPWTGVNGHFVRISTQILSGRRLEAVGAGNVSR
jgi:nitroimidazol reductase NimA-like FMN-containing flavoprotein (pyridoxamine 5'-phosphate oxidase superfamily)